jgi:chromosomal replication initiation ATPase DnaA
MASQPRTCAECGGPIDPRNRSGYCTRHQNASPEKRRKISEALKRGHQLHPEWREQRRQAAIKAARNPANRERRAQLCRERRLWEKGVAGHTPETRAKIAATQRAKKMAWCPPHLRAEARRLSQSLKLPHAEVRRIILEHHEAELRRFRRSHGIDEPEAAAPAVDLPAIPEDAIDDTTAAAVIAAIAAAFVLEPGDLTGKCRSARLMPARHACCFILWRLSGSYAQAGRWLGGRDHSTIIHACRQFEKRATPEMRALAERFIARAA